MLGLGTGSAVTTGDQIPSLPLGAVATLAFIVLNPIATSGGRQARQHPDVDGVPGLRIGGWVLYGLATVNALAAVGLGAADEYVHPAVIGTLTLLGVTSSLFFAIDGFVTASEADEAGGPSAGPRIAPSLSFFRDPADRLRPTFGIGGRF
ncbi:MAG: hypothetical protein ACODAU_06030 [Myxococcota bacterium]